MTATTPSNIRGRPPFCRLPAKRDSPSWYIEKPSQHMSTDTAYIQDVVFTSSYHEDRVKFAATVPTVLEGDIGGRIPALPDTPENIQFVRSGAGFHGGIKRVSGNGSSGWYLPPPDPGESGRGKRGRNRIHTSKNMSMKTTLRRIICYRYLT